MSKLVLNAAGLALIEKRLGQALISIARRIVKSEQEEYVQGPPRSQPGEHLRAETWNAHDSLTFTPKSAVQAGRQMFVVVGYTRHAWYAAWWSDPRRGAKRRAGLREKFIQFQGSGSLGGFSWREEA